LHTAPKKVSSHHELIGAVLDPVGIEAEVRLAVGLQTEVVALDELGPLLLQHPPKRYAGGAVRAHRVGRWKKVAVRLRVALDVGMSLGDRDRERRHEVHALGHARWKLVR
jgi:hypothetical protein